MKKKFTAFLMSFLMCFSMIGTLPITSVYAEEPTETPTQETTVTTEGETIIDADVVYQEDLDAYGLVFDEVNSQVFNRAVYTDGSDWYIFAHSGNAPNAWYLYSDGEWFKIAESTVSNATATATPVANTVEGAEATTKPTSTPEVVNTTSEEGTVNANGEVLEQLDNGEYVLTADDFSDATQGTSLFGIKLFATTKKVPAKVESMTYIGAYTGTAPFDKVAGAGNDTLADDDIVRSYDKIYYRTSYSSTVENVGEISTNATYHFEAFLPMDFKYAEWDLQSMKWLQNATVVNENGGQKLTGEVIFDGGQAAPRIGILNWVVTVKGIENQAKITEPEFSMWLDDTTPVDTIGSAVYGSAFPNYDAQINFEGTDIDGGELWSIGFALRASIEDKGIKGQQIPAEGSKLTTVVTFTHQQNLIDYKLNNNVDTGVNSLIATESIGTKVPYDDGAANKIINDTTVYNGGTITAIDNGNHTATITIRDFEFSPDALIDGVTKNALASETAGNAYNDDTYNFASILIKTSTPVGVAKVDTVNATIDSELVGATNSKDNNENNNKASLMINGGGAASTGYVGYGPFQHYYYYIGRYNESTGTIQWSNDNTYEQLVIAQQGSYDAFLNIVTTAPGNYFQFQSAVYIEPKYAEFGGMKTAEIFYKLDGDTYAPVPGYTFGEAYLDYTIAGVNNPHEDITSNITSKKYVTKANGLNWTNDDELKSSRINNTDYHFYDTAEEVIASGEKLVGFYIVIDNIPQRGLTDLYEMLIVNYPAVKVKDTSILDSNGKVYSKDNPKLMSITTSDVTTTGYNGFKSGQYAVTGLPDTGEAKLKGDSYIAFAKPTYDANGNIVSGGTYQAKWQSSMTNSSVWSHSPVVSGMFAHLEVYNTYLNHNIVNMVEGTTEYKTIYNLDDDQRRIEFEIESGTYSSSNTLEIENDPITVSVTIPNGLNPVDPTSTDIETKWGIGYAGTSSADTTTNGGSGVTWTGSSNKADETEQWLKVMEETKGWRTNDASYTITEGIDETGHTTLTWVFTNYPIRFALPNIHYAGLIGTSEDSLTADILSGTQMQSTAFISTSALSAISNTKGFVPIRMGGATIKKTANPANRTTDDSSIGFDVLFEDEGILTAENQGKVAVVDILPYEGDEFNNPDMGDYTLTNVSLQAQLKKLNYDGANTPTLTFYYTEEDPTTVKTDVGDFLGSNGSLYNFSDSYWQSVSIAYANDYQMNTSAVTTALSGKKITAIGWVMENQAETSQIKFHYAYDWEDSEFKTTMENDSIVYNRAYVAGEDGIVQKTHSQDKSISAISKKVIGINDNVNPNNNLNGGGIEVGDILTYQINYLNMESTTATIDVYDPIPEFTEYVEGSADNNGKLETIDGVPTVHWTIENVASMDRGTVTFKVKVLDTATEKVENQGYDIINGNRYDTNIVENPLMKLTAVKSSDPVSGTKVNRGDTIKYYVTVTNEGENTIPFTQIRDYIPEGTTYVADSVSLVKENASGTTAKPNGSCAYNADGNYTECVGIDVAPGDDITMSFMVTVDEDCELEKVVNSALYQGFTKDPGKAGEIEGDPGKQTNEVEHPLANPIITMVKSSDPETGTKVNRGDTIKYILTITNEGNGTAKYVPVKDYIPEGTTYVTGSATQNGVFVASPKTDDETLVNGYDKGKGAIEWVVTNVKPNDTITLEFEVTVDLDTDLSKVENIALYDQSYKNPGKPGELTKDPTTETNKVEHPLGEPNLVGVKSSDPVSGTIVNLGDEVKYTIAITNNGDGVAPFVPVRDYIPAGTSYVKDSVSTGGAYVEKLATTTDEKSGNYVEWVLTDVEPGETREVSFSIKVNNNCVLDQIENVALYENQYKNPGKPGELTKDPEQETNKVIHPLGEPMIEAIKSSNPVNGTTVLKGDTITYTVTIKNSGTGIARFVQVKDYIPEGTTYVENSITSPTNASGVFVKANAEGTNKPYVEWVLTNVMPGESRDVTFKVTVNSDITLDKVTNVALYESFKTDPGKPGEITKDPVHETNKIIHPLGQPHVTVVKKSDPVTGTTVKKGQTITYCLEVTNDGTAPVNFTHVRDYIPLMSTYVENSVSSVSGAQGAYVNASSDGAYVEWVLDNLGVGETRTVSFKVTVNQDAINKIINEALYDWMEEDPGTPGTITAKPSIKTNQVVHPLAQAKPVQTGDVTTITPYVVVAGCGVAMLLLIAIAMVLKKKKTLKTSK